MSVRGLSSGPGGRGRRRMRRPTSRRRAVRQRRVARDPRRVQTGARRRLRGFSQATILAIALTAFLLLLFGDDVEAQEATPAGGGPVDPDTVRVDTIAREATTQARQTFEDLWIGFVGNLPQVVVATMVLLLAWGLARLSRPAFRSLSRRLGKGNAIAVLASIAIWLIGIGVAVSVLAGDIRALFGSLGLIGLALSWALQTPIESFTGWLLNSFKGYYRVGDRIAVGDVFGDVTQIDVLTTTVWEYGGADRAASNIAAEQPTGRLITFPNNEVLTGSIINYTRDFPYMWDELPVSVAAESDLAYGIEVATKIADELLGEMMTVPARAYADILRRARLDDTIPDRPQVFVTMTPSGVDLVIRYLVGARERRIWKSRLTQEVVTVFNLPENASRILPLYPRQQIQVVGPDGAPCWWPPHSPAARS
jgi:small-conductance mechanosensitive channel